MMKPSDEQLAELTLKDKKNFNPLVNKYAPKIRVFIARIIGNWQEAEDLTQETFFRAYRGIASFNPKLKFSSWLYRIAHNQAVNYIKKNYRFKTVEFSEEIKNKFFEEKDILETVYEKENAEEIKKALFKLNSSSREILELAFFEEKSYLEIADILEISVNSVGPNIKRAKDKLKHILEEKHGKFNRKN